MWGGNQTRDDVDDYYDNDELDLIWDELHHMTYPHKWKPTSKSVDSYVVERTEDIAKYAKGKQSKVTRNMYIGLSHVCVHIHMPHLTM